MGWSSSKLLDINKSLVEQSTLNVNKIMRDIRIKYILGDYENLPIFPYITTMDGNIKIPFLRKPGIEFDPTGEEIEKIEKLKKEPLYLSKFIKFNTSAKIFDLYPKQKEFIENYPKNRFNIIKKSRQVGMSSMLSLILLHYSLTKSNKNIFYISPAHSCEHDFNRFVHFLGQIPFYASVGVSIYENKTVNISDTKSIEFENGCLITFTSKLPTHNSQNIDFLIVDQATHLELEKIITLVSPRLEHDSQLFVASSPKDGSYFNIIFQNESMVNWNKDVLDWDIVPERDTKWVIETVQMVGGLQNFLDEYSMDSMDKIRDLKIDLLNI